MQIKMKSRVLALVLVSVMIALSMSGCKATVNDPVIGTVGDVEVRYSDMYQFYSTYSLYYNYGMITLMEGQTFGDYLLNLMVEAALPLAVAYDKGMTLTAEEEVHLEEHFEEEYQKVIEQAGASLEEGATDAEIKKAFLKTIKESGFTEKSYREALKMDLRDDMLIQKVLEEVYAEADVTDEDVKAWYDENLEADQVEFKSDLAAFYELYTSYEYDTGIPPLYTPDGFFYVKQIFIGNAPEGATDEQVKAVADKVAEVQAKIDAGEDFDALVAEYNDDPGMESSPEGYYYADAIAEKYYPEFSAAASKLAVGEISGPVVSSEGTHFLYKTGKVRSGDLPFEEVEESIRAALQENEEYELYRIAIEKWFSEIEIDIDTNRANYYLNTIAANSSSSAPTVY